MLRYNQSGCPLELPKSFRDGMTLKCPHCQPGDKPGFFLPESLGIWKFFCFPRTLACPPPFSLVCPTYSCWARLPVSDGMVEHWGSQLCPTPSFFLPFGHPPLGFQSAWICSTSSQTWAVLASVRHPCLPSVLATSSPAASPCAAGLASAPPTHTSGAHPTVYLISTAWHLHPGVLYRRWSTRSHNGSGYN